MDWVAIIEMLIPIIKDCLNKDDAKTISKRIKAKGPRVVMALRSIGKERGLRGRELRTFIDDCCVRIDETPDSELTSFCESCKE